MTNMIYNDQIYQVTHPQCPTTCISLLDRRNIINLLPQTNSSPPLVTKVFSQCNILSPPSLSKFRPHPIKHFSSCLLSTSVQIMQSQVVLMCFDAKPFVSNVTAKENTLKSLFFGLSHFAICWKVCNCRQHMSVFSKYNNQSQQIVITSNVLSPNQTRLGHKHYCCYQVLSASIFIWRQEDVNLYQEDMVRKTEDCHQLMCYLSS